MFQVGDGVVLFRGSAAAHPGGELAFMAQLRQWRRVTRKTAICWPQLLRLCHWPKSWPDRRWLLRCLSCCLQASGSSPEKGDSRLLLGAGGLVFAAAMQPWHWHAEQLLRVRLRPRRKHDVHRARLAHLRRVNFADPSEGWTFEILMNSLLSSYAVQVAWGWHCR